MNIYNARIARLRNAIEMKPVDKIPVSINGPAFVARAQGLSLKDAITDFPRATQASIDLLDRLETADSIQTPIIWPETLANQWLSKVASPGFELGDDELWQVEEAEVVKFEDYEYILKHGFNAFQHEVLANRLQLRMEKMPEFFRAVPVAAARCVQAGYPVINDAGNIGTPIESMCGGRSLANFFMDLMDEPELLSDVFRVIHRDNLQNFRTGLEQGGKNGFGAWVGGWRAAPSLISNDIFDEFVWPYLKELALTALEFGITPIFHLDSCWDRAFHHFTELPAHKCLISLDGTSDIRLCRSIVGDHSAIMGDVPASLLAFASASEVYDYTTKLIADVGPKTGLIVCSGCDIPLNARFENVKAMVDAAADYLR